MPLGWTYFHFLIEALVLKISQEITQESIAAVNFLVRENRRITTREIADSLSVSTGTKKKTLKGRRFTDNDEVRETVEEWFRTQPKTFFADGIHRLVDQWDTCFNQQGDYV